MLLLLSLSSLCSMVFCRLHRSTHRLPFKQARKKRKQALISSQIKGQLVLTSWSSMPFLLDSGTFREYNGTCKCLRLPAITDS